MIDQLKALADENRMRIVNLLLNEELCVCELETILDMSQSNTSRHLTKLKHASIISSSKDAQWVHYKVSKDFRLNHGEMVNYLKEMLSKEEPYVTDFNKLRKYNELGLSCKDIKENSQRVVALIQEV